MASWAEPPTDSTTTVEQDRPPNFRADDGRLYLVRCFACSPKHGRENWVLNVAAGVCTWCGWSENA